MGLDVAIKPIPNPRKEKEEHYYNPTHLRPHRARTRAALHDRRGLGGMLRADARHQGPHRRRPHHAAREVELMGPRSSTDKSVLVTGACGTIGRELVRQLARGSGSVI